MADPMTDADKPDPGAEFLQRLLAEGEAERVEKLSHEELLSELEGEGYPASRIPTEEQLLARLTARAAREGKSLPLPPPTTPTSPPAPTSSQAPGRFVTIRTRRVPQLVWLLAAALGLFLIVVNWPETIAKPPHDAQEAAELRAKAKSACDASDYGACRALLDQASAIDAAGESDPEVQAERKKIAEWTRQRP
jgi:hypothetical protein